MILIDNNQLFFSTVHMLTKQGVDFEDDPNILLRSILNSYRYYRRKFHGEYGELVICHDSMNCWRKDFFPNYKASRRKSRKESNMDWDKIHNLMDIVRRDIEENLPYRNVKVEKAEADDIIAVLCREYSHREKIVIISNDKDFKQLQLLPNVKQYSPMQKKYIVCEYPENFRMDHIIRGDSSDGIPNVLSDDDVFISDDKRQVRMTSKRYDEIVEQYTSGKTKDISNWNRNETLIDLFSVPDIIAEKVIHLYESTTPPNRSGLLNFFISRQLQSLLGAIEEF